jgi:hypothetical protein
MQVAMVITWSGARAGRELSALDYGVRAAEFWGRHAAEGRCTPPEMFFRPAGGGMWMVKGDLDALTHINVDNVLLVEGGLVLEDFRYEYLDCGPSADEFLVRYAGAIESLGLG